MPTASTPILLVWIVLLLGGLIGCGLSIGAVFALRALDLRVAQLLHESKLTSDIAVEQCFRARQSLIGQAIAAGAMGLYFVGMVAVQAVFWPMAGDNRETVTRIFVLMTLLFLIAAAVSMSIFFRLRPQK
jgi:uncharacterized membrane protein YidH (DUF202 family)